MKVAANPPGRSRRSSPHHSCLPIPTLTRSPRASIHSLSMRINQRRTRPLFSRASNMPFQQPLCLDIDTILPQGWGDMSRLIPFSTPAKHIPVQPLCKSPLYFQQLTNCLFAKSFSLIFMQTAPGGGGWNWFCPTKSSARGSSPENLHANSSLVYPECRRQGATRHFFPISLKIITMYHATN
jgi:hypothetical protein